VPRQGTHQRVFGSVRITVTGISLASSPSLRRVAAFTDSSKFAWVGQHELRFCPWSGFLVPDLTSICS
jgi:hypothetical protein